MIGKAAIIGGGVIGAGWAARLALNGIDVSIFDPRSGLAKKGLRGAGECSARIRESFTGWRTDGRNRIARAVNRGSGP